MTDDILSLKKIQSEDIFRYVVGNTLYCPIEQQIDPSVFEVYETCIYNGNTKQFIAQNKEFVNFQEHLSTLKEKAPNMSGVEIQKVSNSIASIAPVTIKI